MTQSSVPVPSLGGDNSERNFPMNALIEILDSHPFEKYVINENDVTVWDKIGPYSLSFEMVFALGKKQ